LPTQFDPADGFATAAVGFTVAALAATAGAYCADFFTAFFCAVA
jgi:hypothetical protein